jgi:hypothetical protein
MNKRTNTQTNLFHLQVDTPVGKIVGSVLTCQVGVSQQVFLAVVPVAVKSKLLDILLVLVHELLLRFKDQTVIQTT